MLIEVSKFIIHRKYSFRIQTILEFGKNTKFCVSTLKPLIPMNIRVRHVFFHTWREERYKLKPLYSSVPSFRIESYSTLFSRFRAVPCTYRVEFSGFSLLDASDFYLRNETTGAASVGCRAGAHTLLNYTSSRGAEQILFETHLVVFVEISLQIFLRRFTYVYY